MFRLYSESTKFSNMQYMKELNIQNDIYYSLMAQANSEK